MSGCSLRPIPKRNYDGSLDPSSLVLLTAIYWMPMERNSLGRKSPDPNNREISLISLRALIVDA